MLNKILVILLYILTILIFIPALITLYIRPNSKIQNTYHVKNNDTKILNYVEYEDSDTDINNIKTNNLDEYITGVLAAEMPVSFEEEALKAQAIAARTYAYRRIDDINSEIDSSSIGQAYNSIDEMKQKWGDNFKEYYEKIKSAVYSTSGIIMTYEGEAIEAVFHSTSAGITETAENVWGNSLPYIKSVESKVDEQAPNFTYTTSISNKDFINKIHTYLPDADKSQIIQSFSIKSVSAAGYVLEVSVCGKTISGKDIRTMFNLRSTNFTIKKNNDSVDFTTKGYGHGAGLSQYGANFMALDGSSYEDILNHYYSNIKFTKIY